MVSTADVSGLVSAMQTAYKYREDSPYLAAQIHQRGFEIAKKWAADIPDDDLRLDVMLGLDQKGTTLLHSQSPRKVRIFTRQELLFLIHGSALLI